jgi:hypothetical protein
MGSVCGVETWICQPAIAVIYDWAAPDTEASQPSLFFTANAVSHPTSAGLGTITIIAVVVVVAIAITLSLVAVIHSTKHPRMSVQ